MFMRRRLGLAAALLLVACTAIAQNGNDRGLMTIEELYLQDDLTIRVLRTQALSVEREHKLAALEQATDLIGTVDERALLSILRVLATDGSSWQVRVGGRRMYDYPDVRREAVRVIGEVGGRSAEVILREVIQYDRNPLVLSEAVYALRSTGISADTGTATVLANLMNRELSRVNPDNNLMYASLLTLESLASDGNEAISNTTLINNLLRITTGPYTRLVREKALDVLNVMRGM
ncbi:MAG: HEAT repeat domain-containing protein [Spirochaetaceae bacterium]|nr:MAG: HEAT repeat domain-containing protein [Spirochaetaceae bacterium]